jgi:4-hydroxy-tetrahydrodipicolinate synthase
VIAEQENSRSHAHGRDGSERLRAPRLPLIGEERERILAIIRRGIATRPKIS